MGWKNRRATVVVGEEVDVYVVSGIIRQATRPTERGSLAASYLYDGDVLLGGLPSNMCRR